VLVHGVVDGLHHHISITRLLDERDTRRSTHSRFMTDVSFVLGFSECTHSKVTFFTLSTSLEELLLDPDKHGRFLLRLVDGH
jgi:hypothetical protein